MANEKPRILGPTAIRQLSDTVRAVRDMRTGGQTQRRRYPVDTPVRVLRPLLARITAAGAADGYYEAVEINGSKADVTDGRVWTNAELGELRELNDTAGLEPVDDEVVAVVVHRFTDDEGNAAWVFAAHAKPGNMFAVDLTQDGGADGDASTQATWTYTVNDLAGNELGTAMTPKKQRPAVGKITNGDGLVGQGYIDAAGDFQLYDANEVEGGVKECG